MRVTAAPLIDATLMPPPGPPALGSVASGRPPLGVATTPGIPAVMLFGSQASSRRQGFVPVCPRAMGEYWLMSSAAGSNVMKSYYGKSTLDKVWRVASHTALM